ncbi:MAG: AAA family ATPase [Deltaproteobacteria bacterium]|nr:AAA family ATPase [Deltaproteobacteria bacterium]
MLEGIASFVPRRLIGMLDPGHRGAHAMRLEVALLSVDITGFTTLSSLWALRGAEGTERITALLERYFAQVVGVIDSHGGEAVYFAGDGILAWWPLDAGGEAEERAVACALELQSTLGGYLVGATELHIKIGVASGPAWLSRLGGVEGRWLLGLTGPALAQVAAAEAACHSDEVRMATGVDGDSVPLTRQERVLPHALPATLVAPPAVEAEPAGEATHWASTEDYVPGIVRERWRGDQSDWLAELRILTVVFVRLDGLASDAIAQLQTAICQIQRVANRLDGAVDKFLVDAKGLTVILVFGLPHRASDDVAGRGIRAASTIAAGLARHGVDCGIGIATGRAYCGPLGPRQRREYAVIGPTVNLAARLMEACERGVLVCDTTRTAATNRVRCVDPTELELKGFPGLTRAWRPVALGGEAAVELALVGRERERGRISVALRQVLADQVICLALLGDPGCGKTALGRTARAEASALGIEVWDVVGDPLEQFSPLHAWRRVALRALGVADVNSPAQAQAVLAACHALNDSDEVAPLLIDLLGMTGRESQDTRHLLGAARAEHTVRVLSDWLARRIGAVPALLLLDDWQWVDTESRKLAAALFSKLPSSLMIVMARHMHGDDPLHPFAEPVPLPPFDEQAAAALLCARTGAALVDPELVATILERTGGNPQFIEQLTEMLVASHSVELAAGQLALAPGGAAQLSAIPTTIEGIVAARVDALDSDAQLTLKVASAIGCAFSLPVLREALPNESARARLPVSLNTLLRRGLVAPANELDPDVWMFQQAIVQEVVHSRLVVGQRKALHHSISNCYLRADPMRASPGVLSRHLALAGDLVEAQRYGEHACSQAMAKGAFVEARAHGLASLELCDLLDEQGATGVAARRVRTLRLLAEIAASMGDLRQSGDFAAHSLTHAGHEPVAGALRWVDVAVQLARVLSGFWAVGPGHTARNRAQGLDVARDWQVLAKVHFFENDVPGMVQACLRFCAEAERSGASPELASAWIAMSTLLAVLPLPMLARRYERRAVDLANSLADPNTSTWVSLVAALNAVGRGAWAEVAEHTAAVQRHSPATRDLASWGSAQALGTWACFYQGDDASVRVRAAALSERAQSQHNAQQVLWADRFLGEQAVLQGQPQQAVALLEPAVAKLRADSDTAELLVAMGGLAQAYAAQGALAKLEATVSASLPLLESMGRPTSHVVAHACACLATAVEVASQTVPAPVWAHSAGASLVAILDRCAAGYATAEPWRAWARAVQAVRARQPRRALRWIARGLTAADRLGMRRARQLLLALRCDAAVNPAAAAVDVRDLRVLTAELGPWLDPARLLPYCDAVRNVA